MLDRPTYTLSIRAEPGTDSVRALRWALKTLLRKYRLRVIAIHEDGKPEPDTDTFYETDMPDGGRPDFEEGGQ